MALADILTAIRRDAEAEIAVAEAEARADMGALLLQAATDGARAEAEVASQRDRELGVAIALIAGEARLAAARTLRIAREQLFRAVLVQVHGRVEALRGEACFASVTAHLLAEGLALMPDPSVVRTDPRDRCLVVGVLDRIGVEAEVDPSLVSAGGLQLVNDTGVVDNTFEQRLANAEPYLRSMFSAALEAQGIGAL